jgi:hypothetical protein
MRVHPHPIRSKWVVGVGLAPTHTQGQPQGLPVRQNVIPAKAGIQEDAMECVPPRVYF